MFSFNLESIFTLEHVMIREVVQSQIKLIKRNKARISKNLKLENKRQI